MSQVSFRVPGCSVDSDETSGSTKKKKKTSRAAMQAHRYVTIG